MFTKITFDTRKLKFDTPYCVSKHAIWSQVFERRDRNDSICSHVNIALKL